MPSHLLISVAGRRSDQGRSLAAALQEGHPHTPRSWLMLVDNAAVAASKGAK